MRLFKRILGIIFAVIGIVMFLLQYVIVILNQADYIKYIVTILGYLCVAIFTIGIVLIKSTIQDKKDNNINEIN